MCRLGPFYAAGQESGAQNGPFMRCTATAQVACQHEGRRTKINPKTPYRQDHTALSPCLAVNLLWRCHNALRGSKLSCAICEVRKEKRFCPAVHERICPQCCGEQHEMTLDCPNDCTYLQQAR